ncbi:DUF881 domain-containing protein [Salipaludibacillus agaradhaerens]|uniref:DUF881 domain-containing protein n=1 Tax=Salipaludibacillus agaradhaerens TaxID=76935 RepID=A0A9Q4B0W3_SALAG|nr:DUF881 domain-containing protein [Salipaludibacillus agaradhaerens]UJW58236.1 DUF881 domain-containing protein [Bacillus sp. A116_S68]MCR6095950.1 DUF881 domain-containing protein [Salipaludibacillus agaradhaerens]MCR6107163.1 DUF881 domain-containing protein [Salipaludibacillus agaradhaerens]MCR6114491.1 DUF881 domain-containing protein [Salipaludibacillus agaradhaerens]MCR6119193.1 DUF881 domain-containing protein [Salipaludibacillus agaradhaerens]
MRIKMLIFTCVTFVIGFMVAVQHQSFNEPPQRDTRNMADLRQALMSEKERQQELNEEIHRQSNILYQLDENEDVEEVMEDVFHDLQMKAGLTEVSGSGIVIEVNVFFDESYSGGGIRSVPPYLLRLLINELNIQGAEHIAIGSERIVSTTAIREANGRTLINGNWMTSFPLEIKVITDDPESMHHAIMSSQSREIFSYENLDFSVEAADDLTLPAYDHTYRVRYMEPVLEDS